MTAAGAGARRLPSAPAAWAIAAFIVGRLVVAASGWAALHIAGAPSPRARLLADPAFLFHGAAGNLLNPGLSWDGNWFAGIASRGYDSAESLAFFPLYPYLVRVTTVIFSSVLVSGIIVSLVCAAAAMVVLYRMVATRYDARTAAWTIAFLSLCPTSLFFQAVYSESLFLLLVVGSLALAERERWAVGCAVGGLAAMTRNTGVLLLVPLFLLYAENREWRLSGDQRLKWPRDARLAWLALVPSGLLIYMGYLKWRVDEPLAFLTVQKAWGRHFDVPVFTLWHGATAAYHSLGATVSRWPALAGWLAPGGRGQWMYAMEVVPFVAAVAGIVVLVVAWNRLPAAYNAWTLLVFVVPLCIPMKDIPLFSLPRFLLLAFPLFVGLALVTVRLTLLRWVLLVLSVVLLAWLSASFALFSWVS